MIIGAHYDHLGRGELGGSRAKTDDIHYGADDNASGTAMLIELAHSLKKRKFKKHNYMFVAFSGEELGLIGSGKFVEFFAGEIAKSRAMLNFDMVGRIVPASPTLYLGGTGTCATWTDLLNTVEDSLTLKVVRSAGGTGSSDHTNFYYQKIPVLSFFTGLHSEYHTPQDVDSLINYQGMELVYNYTMQILEQMNKKPYRKGTFQSVQEEKKETRAAFKVTLGVMPDYGYTGAGLRISGANPGGVAEKAGLQAGDIVTKIGDHDITDIYKYMEVLGLFRKGEEAEIKVLRNGEEISMKVTF